MALINQNKLDFWVKNNLNVVFRGKHGVGKTHIIKDTFEKHGLRWLYFSAATMDPWVDFIGVPKEQTEDGITFLDLVRPKVFQKDEVDAIFFDELNRAPKKVRNAVMELMQFKSINGKRFDNLKMIWAAINPADDSETSQKYDVEDLDPAQLDRFHIIFDVPYKPDLAYLVSKHGDNGKSAHNWWFKLSDELKDLISPRRLDYMLDIFNNGGDIKDCVHDPKINVSSLIDVLKNGSVEDRLKALVSANDKSEAKTVLNNLTFLDQAFKIISKDKSLITFFFDVIPKDFLVKKLTSDKAFLTLCINTVDGQCVKDDLLSWTKTKEAKKNKLTADIINWFPIASDPKSAADVVFTISSMVKQNNTYKRLEIIEVLSKPGVISEHNWEGITEVLSHLLCRTTFGTLEINKKFLSIVRWLVAHSKLTKEAFISRIDEFIKKSPYAISFNRRLDIIGKLGKIV